MLTQETKTVRTGTGAGTPAQTLLSQSAEALQIVKVNGNYVVISALDSLSIGEGTDFGDNYRVAPGIYLFAENVLLSGRFQMKNGLLSTHSLSAAGMAVLDVSGANGTSEDTPNENTAAPGIKGGNGDPAGIFSLYLEQASRGLTAFSVDAHGGDGGAGQSGTQNTPGADGGTGGKGGTVVLVTGIYYLDWLSQLQTISKMTSLDTQQAALKDLISLISGTDPTLVSLIQTLTDASTASQQSDAMTSIHNAALQLQALSSGYAAKLISEADVSGGNYGVYGDGKTIGKNGDPGGVGSVNSVVFGVPDELATKTFPAFFLVHPSQCERMLNKIRLMYYTLDPVNNPGSVTDLMTLLLRLQARTQLFADLDDASPLAQYYAANEADMGSIDSLTRLRSINEEVTQYLIRLKQGQDVFGYTSNSVPLASFQFYKDLLNQVITNFAIIETNYNAYFTALQTQAATMDAIRSARDQQNSIITQATAQLSLLRGIAQKTATVIDSYQTVLPPLKQAVEDAIAKLKEDISHYFDFNWESVFQSLTSLAFAPESQFMMVTQASQFLYNGITKVTNDKGEPIDKNYIVSQLKTVQADVDSLQEGYSALDNGLLAADDPGAGKLIADEQQVMTFFQDFYSKFPKDLDAVKKAFDDYIQQIIARNNQILTYNAVVVMMLKDRQAIDDATAARNTLNDNALSNLAPDLPDLVTFVSSLYYNARMQVMETLDLTARAFRFWSLSDKNLIQTAYGGKSLPQINYTALVGAQNTILNNYQQAIENFGTNSSSFPSHTDDDGLMVELPDYQVDLFRQIGQVMVNLPEVTPQTTEDDSVFAGMANVRVMVVRAWIYGVSTSDGRVQVQITHTGDEKITSTTGDVYTFSHEPVNKLFIYQTHFDPANKSKSIFEDANFGLLQADVQGSGNTNTYAALGPFTKWRIAVDAGVNKALDLSNVSRIVLEFRGTNFSFN